MEKDIAKVVIDEGQIRGKLLELSKTLINDYKEKDWTIIAILNGSLIFLADLIRLIPFPVRLDTVDATAYGESTFPKEDPKIIRQFKIDIEDKHVLIMDDIIDTGGTMKRVIEDIKKYNPRSLKSCVLLSRIGRRQYNIKPDYCCFDIGNEFVVGYGLDYNNKYRNLPFIAILKDECYRHNA